jgi:hypothetical protein
MATPMQIRLAVEHKDEKYTHDVSFSRAQTLNVTRNPLSAMNMFQNASLLTLGRHGNFTARVTWNSQICCVPHLR